MWIEKGLNCLCNLLRQRNSGKLRLRNPHFKLFDKYCRYFGNFLRV